MSMAKQGEEKLEVWAAVLSSDKPLSCSEIQLEAPSEGQSVNSKVKLHHRPSALELVDEELASGQVVLKSSLGVWEAEFSKTELGGAGAVLRCGGRRG